MRVKATWRMPATSALTVSGESSSPSGSAWKAIATTRSNVVAASAIRSRAFGPTPSESTSTSRGPLGVPATSSSSALQAPCRRLAQPRSATHASSTTLARPRHDDVVGRQEARFLVGELLVEGAPRDAGQGDHVRDRRARVAALGDRLDHAPVHARALVARYVLARHPVGAVRQPAVDR